MIADNLNQRLHRYFDEKDDPCDDSQSWFSSFLGRKVTFLGKKTTIDQLLGLGSYTPVKAEIKANKGKWELFQNQTNYFALYISNIDFRFLVQADKGLTDRDTLTNDLELITFNSLETDWASKQYQKFSVPLWLGFSALGTATGFLVGHPIIGALAGAFGGAFPSRYIAFKLMDRKFPLFDRKLNGLSKNAGEYLFTKDALNYLKVEALRNLANMHPVPIITEKDCTYIESIADAQIGAAITLRAVPLAPFKTPHSKIVEEGKIEAKMEGTMHGYWQGLLAGSFHGEFEGKINGSYSGLGDVQGIRSTTPIEFLMEDESGRRFVVYCRDLAAEIQKEIEALEKNDLYSPPKDNRNLYLTELAGFIRKFSMGNSHLFYETALPQIGLPMAERKPVSICGYVDKSDELPTLQLLGFTGYRGNYIVTQPYPIAELGKTLLLKPASDVKLIKE